MTPAEIKFLRAELLRVSPDVLLTGRNVRWLQSACVETLAALERSVAGPLDEDTDVPEEALELLPLHFEPMPSKLAPPLRGIIVYVGWRYGVVRSAGKVFRFRGREIVGEELSDELVGKEVEFDIKTTSKGPRAISVYVVEQ